MYSKAQEATTRLLGRANWWAPRPLRRLYATYGIAEVDDGPAAGKGTVPVSAARGQ